MGNASSRLGGFKRPRLSKRKSKGKKNAPEHAKLVLFDLGRLPPELVRIILQHLLASYELGPPQIQYRVNHAVHNHKLAHLANLARVNKAFYYTLRPHLYQTLHLPRHHNYAHSAVCVRDREFPMLHAGDEGSYSLQSTLERKPELAGLVKRIHVDPVIRLRSKASPDAEAYAKIIEMCRDHIEELAVAVNDCDGGVQRIRGRLTIGADGKSLVLRKLKTLAFTALRHLVIETMDSNQLKWFRWTHAPNLTSVVFVNEFLFDYTVPSLSAIAPAATNFYKALSHLPPSVTTVTFGFMNLTEDRDLAHQRRLSTSFPGQNDNVTYFASTFHPILIALRKKKPQLMQSLKTIRLVWTHSPHSFEWCTSCLERHRRTYFPLPRWRRVKSVEQRYLEINARHGPEEIIRFDKAPEKPMAERVRGPVFAPQGSSSTALPDSAEASSASTPVVAEGGEQENDEDDKEDEGPTIDSVHELEFFEVRVPPAYEPNDESETAMHSLEVLWKALLYNKPDEGGAAEGEERARGYNADDDDEEEESDDDAYVFDAHSHTAAAAAGAAAAVAAAPGMPVLDRNGRVVEILSATVISDPED